MRVVIAEDFVLLRDGIARALSRAGIEVVAEVGDGASLLEAVERLRPDLVVSDVRMPPTFADEGARAVLVIRDRFPSTGVLVLSQSIDPQLAMSLVTAQPDGFGYLLKDRVLEGAEFIASVRAVAEGRTVIDPLVVEDGLRRRSEPLAVLTERERQVLSRLAQGQSNRAIAIHLVVSERTVEAHLRTIFTKLELPEVGDANRRVHAALVWLGASG